MSPFKDPARRLAYARDYYSRNRLHIDGQQRQYRAAHRERPRAMASVASALTAGLLIRPLFCERCGAGGTIDAHHHDYTQPLVVEWLCRSCHKREHWQRRLSEAP